MNIIENENFFLKEKVKRLEKENARLREALDEISNLKEDIGYYTVPSAGASIAIKALQGKEDTQTYCKDCGIETKSGSGSARCPDCWDDRFGGKEE